MEIIARKEAKRQQLPHYFTNKPCKRGHVAKRRTSSGSCTKCDAVHRELHHEARLEACKRWRENNKELDAQYHKEWYQRNSTHRKEISKRWKRENAEHYSEQQKYYYQRTKAERAKYHRDRWKRIRVDELARQKAKREQEKIEQHKIFMEQAVNMPFGCATEQDFKWYVAGRLIETFDLEVFEEEYLDEEKTSRIDLIVPSIRLGIEVKLDPTKSGTRWSTQQVTEQVSRYSALLGDEYDVVVVSPTGHFEMSCDDLIPFVEDRLQ